MWQAVIMQMRSASISPSFGVMLVVTALLVAACAERTEPTPQPKMPTVAASPTPPPTARAPVVVPLALPTADPASNAPGLTESFELWRDGLRKQVLAQGIRPDVFDSAFAGLSPNPRVVQLDRGQPEVKASYAGYVGRRLTPARISQGLRMRAEKSVQLAAAEQRYGVDANLMVGIWGMETSYGADMGSFDVIRSLASLAYDGRRSAMFRRELVAALTMLDKGMVPREQLRGSWAGAMGHPQFMPSSYLELGQDGDGDGRIDIWNNLSDVFASMGNYFHARGWRTGVPWGGEVQLPAGYDPQRYVALNPPTGCKRALEKHSGLRPVGQWKADGLVPSPGMTGTWPADDVLASVVRPDGDAGPAFLVTENYRVVLNYNCSNYYALSVLLLADRVGAPPAAAAVGSK